MPRRNRNASDQRSLASIRNQNKKLTTNALPKSKRKGRTK